MLFARLSPTPTAGEVSDDAALQVEHIGGNSHSLPLSADQISQKLFEWYDFVLSSVLDISSRDWVRNVNDLRLYLPSSLGKHFNETVARQIICRFIFIDGFVYSGKRDCNEKSPDSIAAAV